ncbi:unnamed protein product [Spodoptera littoralis]|uniref:Uncharacterized protein n=1 Tax=Spodoptera littoralis TaxID=7109 RepID=A0A9P0N1D7_SPOLI|nr:unnamed protein product [Spodoptera littoralis]CAH1637970.1 unnamed protein product [Spodoptera littoralis]
MKLLSYHESMPWLALAVNYNKLNSIFKKVYTIYYQHSEANLKDITLTLRPRRPTSQLQCQVQKKWPIMFSVLETKYFVTELERNLHTKKSLQYQTFIKDVRPSICSVKSLKGIHFDSLTF